MVIRMGGNLKIKKINDNTAVDSKGAGWFLLKTKEDHCYWATCEKCGKKTQFYWSKYPEWNDIICNDCVEE